MIQRQLVKMRIDHALDHALMICQWKQWKPLSEVDIMDTVDVMDLGAFSQRAGTQKPAKATEARTMKERRFI